ncbi:uncharacterized protein LOC133735497 [Rosa rugosa]|uniref:uncharacterized protein LOC133735497 n=1 Tax=Rosa rugosa TaxID=74645 RepID=UPI002B4150FB|nr:uncharacterized protein LOC133735497 [Rosa rugosa]
MLPSGYLIRPCEGGGSIIHIVDHLNLEAWSVPEVLRPLYESSKVVAQKRTIACCSATIPAKLCKRESTKQFHNSKIKFPLNSDEAFMLDYVLILILEQVQSGKASDKLLFTYFPFLVFWPYYMGC